MYNGNENEIAGEDTIKDSEGWRREWELTFVTRNNNKLKEARALLSPLGIDVVGDAGGYTEVQADTLEEVATFGAKEALLRLGVPLFVEDAGLFVDSLNGFPGPYSAYVYNTIGNEGILKLMYGVEERSAHFISCVCLAYPGGEMHIFEGRVDGRISTMAQGQEGFGFDPIFEVEGIRFAEMTQEEKNIVSHRGRALRKMVDFLEKKRHEKA